MFTAIECGTVGSMPIRSYTASQWPTASTIGWATPFIKLVSEDGFVARFVHCSRRYFGANRRVRDDDDDIVVVVGVETVRRSAAELNGPNMERDVIRGTCGWPWPSSSSIPTGKSMERSSLSVMSAFTKINCGEPPGELPSREDSDSAEDVVSGVAGLERVGGARSVTLRAPRICSSNCAKSSHKPRKLADTSIFLSGSLCWHRRSCAVATGTVKGSATSDNDRYLGGGTSGGGRPAYVDQVFTDKYLGHNESV
jgi:hypothetical protein